VLLLLLLLLLLLCGQGRPFHLRPQPGKQRKRTNWREAGQAEHNIR
jgi:hypothetical protein